MTSVLQPDLRSPLLTLGLMSGTSADGIDAAVLETDGDQALRPIGGVTCPYEPDLRDQLIRCASRDIPLADVLRLEDHLTRRHAAAVHQACETCGVSLDEVAVIGFHGHTIRHLPDEQLTWQLGNGPLLAQLTGRTVVCDFRRHDMAAGGQGAPLAPLYHQAMLLGKRGSHVVINIGGVANITWIDGERILAGDTGPGCGLLNEWVERSTGAPFDRDGHVALGGRVHRDTVRQALRQIPFFDIPLPKSADRFDFAAVDVSHLSPADGAATLCAVTVEAMIRTVARLPSPPTATWVGGGGSHHPLMMTMLAESLPRVASIAELGHDADLIEAECFAWLAVRRLRDLPATMPTTTGARHPTCGGVICRNSSIPNERYRERT